MIYFIRAGKNGPIKIGYSDKSPYSRLNNLQTANYKKLYLIAIMSGGLKTESDIHNKFKYAWIRGEWFYPTIKLMRFINSREFVNLKNHKEVGHTRSFDTTENRIDKALTLWDNGERDISNITQAVYNSYGGNQRNRVIEWLKNNGKI